MKRKDNPIKYNPNVNEESIKEILTPSQNRKAMFSKLPSIQLK